MKNRDSSDKVVSKGPSYVVTRLTLEEDFALMRDFEKLERRIKDVLPGVRVRIYNSVNNKVRYNGNIQS